MEVAPGRVSVIVPAYNAAKYLARSLGSIEQDEGVGEIIVIDNASSDGTADVARSRPDPRIRVIESKENLGASRGRHLGILEARHDLICFLDADDFLAPGSVAAGAAAVAERDLEMAIFDMVRVDEAGENPVPFISPPADVLDGTSAFLRTVGGWKIQPMGVFRKSVYLEATRGIDFHGFSDDELVSRLMFLEARRVGGSEGVYYYRHVPKAVSPAQRISQARTDVKVFKLALDRVEGAERNPVVLGARNFLLRRVLTYAIRGLANGAYAAEAQATDAEVRRLTQGWPAAPAWYRAMHLVARMLLLFRRR